MSTNIVKQGTSLTSSSPEELAKLSGNAGVNPITPLGAKAVGANPDQAKMANTPARKDSVFATQNTDTLDKTVRTEPQKPASAAANEPAKDKLERMKTLGSLNMQVENLANQKLAELNAQNAKLQLNQTSIDALPTEQKAGVTTALQAYQVAASPEAKEAAILQASKILGRVPSEAEMQSFFQDARASLGETAKSVGGSVTLGDLHLAGIGTSAEQLANDLGMTPEQVGAMSPAQLNKAIQDLEAREFNDTQALQAEYASATGQRKQQIAQELKAKGATGAIGVEAQYDRLQASIEAADQISFGGKSMSIEDLLKDDGLSQTIMDATEDKNVLENLKATEPELAEWIQTNMESLAGLTADARTAASGVGDTQQAAADLKSAVSDGLFTTLFGEQAKFMSAAELAQLKTTAEANGVWQTLQTDGDFKARLEKNPALAQAVAGMSKEDIAKRMATTKALESDSNLAKLVGYTPGGIADLNQATNAVKWADTFKALPASVSANEMFQKAVKDGSITPEDAAKIVSNPLIWDKVETDAKLKQKWDLVKGDPQKMLNTFFGSDITIDDFNKGLSRLESYAKMGDEDALSKYNYIKKNLAGADGKLGPEDSALMEQFAKQSADLKPTDIIAGKNSFADLLGASKSALQAGASFESADTQKRIVSSMLIGDGKVTNQEAQQLMDKYGPEEFMSMMDSGWFGDVLEDKNKWSTTVQGIKDNRAFDSYLDTGFKTGVQSSLSSVSFLKNVQGDRNGNISFELDPSFIKSGLAGANKALGELDKQIAQINKMSETMGADGKAKAQASLKSLNSIKATLTAVQAVGATSGINSPNYLQNVARFKDPALATFFLDRLAETKRLGFGNLSTEGVMIAAIKEYDNPGSDQQTVSSINNGYDFSNFKF